MNLSITNHRNKIIFLLIILNLILYGNSIKNNYSLDDGYVTTTNPQHPNNRIEKGIKGIPAIFTTHYIAIPQQNFGYRPIPLATFAIEYQFFGANPHVSHFINLLIYIVTCVVLFLLLSQLLNNYHLIFPLLITILFLFHPIHTEVVDNIKSRDELLTFLFGISSLFYFLKNYKQHNIKYIIYAILLFSLALLCKPTAIIFIAIIPLTIYFFTDIKIKKLTWYLVIPLSLYLVYVLLLKLLFHSDEITRKFAFFENPLFYEPNFFKRIPMAIYTAGYYFKLMILPYPLACYYGFKTIPMANWTFISVWISLAFHLFILFYALINLRQKKIISYAILLYLIGLFPFLNLVIPVVGIIGERFVYIASLGFCFGLAYLLLTLFHIQDHEKQLKWATINFNLKIIILLLISVYGIQVIARNKVWYNELTLFRNDVKQFKQSCNLNYIAAESLSKEIRVLPNGYKKTKLIKEAKRYFNRTATLMSKGLKDYPNDYITLNNLGVIYVDVFNNPNLAQPLFKKVIKINPQNLDAQFNYGFCYEKRNLPDSAMLWYNKLVANKIKYLQVYLHLNTLYIKHKYYNKAIISNKQGTTVFPNNVSLHVNLGNAYMLNTDTLNALKYFEKAASIPPLDYVLLQNVSNVFKTIGNNKKAKQYEKKAQSVMYNQ